MAPLRPALHQLDQPTRPLKESEAAIAQQLGQLDNGWTDAQAAQLLDTSNADKRPPPAPHGAGASEVEVSKQRGTIRRVRGGSGSGSDKSFGLAARAAHLTAQGKRVLSRSFNVAVANHLRIRCGQRTSGTRAVDIKR
jgi:hypothetical protein